MRALISVVLFVASIPPAACGGPAQKSAADPGYGAKSAEATATTPEAPVAGAVKPLGEAKVGDKTRCAVMNHEFVVTEQSPKVEYEGKTYYFCCPGCVEQFKADPKKYLSKPQS